MGVITSSLKVVNIYELGGKFYRHKPLKRSIFVQFEMHCGLWKVCYHFYQTRVNFSSPTTSVGSKMGYCRTFFAFLISDIC